METRTVRNPEDVLLAPAKNRDRRSIGLLRRSVALVCVAEQVGHAPSKLLRELVRIRELARKRATLEHLALEDRQRLPFRNGGSRDLLNQEGLGLVFVHEDHQLPLAADLMLSTRVTSARWPPATS
jgi:hypothetical protein